MRQALLLLTVLAMAGCSSIGPGSVGRDRFDYTAAVADSWKSQMLLNLVKIRYGDAPVFLDVGQVVAGYSFQRGLSASANANVFTGPVPSDQVPPVTAFFGLSGQGTFNDSPTITYTPLAGERFARQMMGPIPPSSVMNVFQAGFQVDVVFRLGVQSVNGVDNRRVQAGYVRPANPEFFALLQDLRRIQASGDIGVRGNKDGTLDLVFRPNLAAAIENSLLNVAHILGLDPAAREFRVVYGAVPSNNKEIAVLTRSMFEVLMDLSSTITVPEVHVTERRVWPTPEVDLGPEGPIPPLVRIASSPGRPDDAFVAAPYRGYWFWIDDRDMASKSTFSFIMFLFTFVETGSKEAAPILTIPTTR